MSSARRRERKTYQRSNSKAGRQFGRPRKAKGAKLRPSNEKTKKEKRMSLFLCSVPFDKCTGASNTKERLKFHTSPEEVLSCKGFHLTQQGYTKINRREYINPETGRILVLTRKPGRAVPGKARYMGRPLKVREW